METASHTTSTVPILKEVSIPCSITDTTPNNRIIFIIAVLKRVNRRTFLATSGTTVAAALAGCADSLPAIGDDEVTDPTFESFSAEIDRTQSPPVATVYTSIRNQGVPGEIELVVEAVDEGEEVIEVVGRERYELDADEVITVEETYEVPEETSEIQGRVDRYIEDESDEESREDGDEDDGY